MIGNYFHIALRNMGRNLRFTLLHLAGLSLGLAAVILIARYVYDELRWDRLTDADRVFRVTTHWGDDPATAIFATSPPPLAATIREEIPEVDQVARAFNWNHSTMRLPEEEAGKPDPVVFRETKIFIVDPNFLEILQYPVIFGDAKSAFQRSESIVLTRRTAIRYFGEDAIKSGSLIGKSILFGGDRTARIVTAVVDPPQNSHLHFDMLVNINFGYTELDTLKAWTWNIMHTYVKVATAPDQDGGVASLQSKLTDIARRNITFSEEVENNGQQPDFRLQPLRDIHLHSHFQREHEPNGDFATVQLLVGVALLITLLACANFVNLFTAQSVRRSKEIGVRKTLGSGRQSLAIQFFAESTMYVAMAALLALSISELLRRPFNQLVGKQLSFDWFDNVPMLIGFIVLLVVMIVLAGTYPSLYLSSFNPVNALKGKLFQRKTLLRNGLVVFQFSISIGLMICSVFIMRQLDFIQNRAPGYDRENVVIVKNDKEVQDQWQVFRAELESRPEVVAATFNSGLPAHAMNVVRDFRRKGEATGTGIHVFLADERYIETLGLGLQTGDNFSDSPQANKGKVLINEAAAKLLGLSQPVGSDIVLNAGSNDEEQLQVIGVVRDFNVESLHNGIKPLVLYYYQPDLFLDYIAVRVRPGNVAKSVAAIEEVWKKFEPENPFEYSFLDEDFESQYLSEQRLSRLFTGFTIFTIAIALLGLTGLASFMSEQRTKEISIRKVLGASVAGIMVLFSREFTRLALTSMAIAIPVSYLVIQQWLNGFAYRIDLSVTVFAGCSVLALLLIWATVSLISLRIARLNPSVTLKNE